MASFFKFSCSIYWLTWLICLSYYVATGLYTDRFIVSTSEGETISMIIGVLCTFNIVYSVIGCVFVKCNITHILYAGLFVLPMIGVNFTFSILGIVYAKRASFPDEIGVIQEAKNYITRHNKYPTWLYHTQLNYNCCGILSYLDYPAFLYSSAADFEASLPQTCCGLNKRRSNCTKGFRIPTPTGRNTTQSAYNAVLVKCKTSNETLNHTMDSKFQSLFRNPNLFDFNNEMYKAVQPCGCLELLSDEFSALYGTMHFVFFILIMILTTLMLFVYIKNWCNNRAEDSGSEHSLDTDNMSLLNMDLKAVQTNPMDTPVKASAATIPGKSTAHTNFEPPVKSTSKMIK